MPDGSESRIGSESIEHDGQIGRLGRVISVTGSQAVVLADFDYQERSDQRLHIQVGSLVKIETPKSMVFGIVSGLTIPVPKNNPIDQEAKIFGLELLGEVLVDAGHESSDFARGISVFPELGATAYFATREDLQKVYEPVGTSSLKVGVACQDDTVPTFVKTDELLGKHFAILGTTGSGKSCLVSIILRRLLDQCPNAHILVLDPHSEYVATFKEQAVSLDQDNLRLPYWMLNFEEIVEVLVGPQAEERNAQVAILSELIPAAKLQYRTEQQVSAVGQKALAETPSGITVDAPFPYLISDLVHMIDQVLGRLDKPDDISAYKKLKARLSLVNSDPRFGFMFGRISGRDIFEDILSEIFRVPVDGKPITIFDLSGVPSEIINVVVSVLSRVTMDFAMRAKQQVPVLLVCEEAHRYAPANSSLGFEPTKQILSRIAKEGRKYGVSLCVVSQRPAELAAGLLSQCNTIFALRLSNDNDQNFVRAATPEAGLGMLDFLPSLRSAEAVVVGEGVSVPMRISFDQLQDLERPRNQSAPFSKLWLEDKTDKTIIQKIIGEWRGMESV